nr:ABC transporter permease [Psittacicella hinzii]
MPPNYGRDLLEGRQPSVGFYIDGAYPSVAENLRSSISGLMSQYFSDYYRSQGIVVPDNNSLLAVRFVYNQDFKSVYALTPGIIMLAIMMIPGIMMAVGIVREKEIGSIMNLYGCLASKMQFLLGKQIPYILLSLVAYLVLVLIAILVFGVPVKGSFLAMLLGAVIAICASTGFGMLVSTFVKTQVAGLFLTAIVLMVPTMNFSGMMSPTSSLPTWLSTLAHLFPGAWFQQISLGGFTKALSFTSFLVPYLALSIIYLVYLTLANLFLKKQEP